ncbi:uncharacterized protein ACN63O_010985 [Diretmus argenteus]
MTGKTIVVSALLVAALLVSGMTSSAVESPSNGAEATERGSGILQRLLARMEKARDNKEAVAKQEQAVQTRTARMERLVQLSEDERDVTAKQIMHAISEIMNSGCMSDRDYQGWVDFGRRSAE